MATPKLSMLTFPQKFKNGKLYVNVLLLPRNINPLTSLHPGFPAFADTAPAFRIMLINSPDGLPVSGNVSSNPTVTVINPISGSRSVWEALKSQIEITDGLKIDDAASADPGNQAQSSLDKYKNVTIRKYLPLTYQNAFNFTRARTRNAVTGDEYHCSVKNNRTPTDVSTRRDKISWGKAIALCLRNPLLARKAGLVHELEITIPPGVLDEGGWLYTGFGAGSAYGTLDQGLIKQYAARIPSLKGLTERVLFAPVQFPVSPVAVSHAGYDEVMREAIIYDDGFAKIVHANQPVNDYLLEEEDKSNPPQKDIGIRLGWDDEQLTIWQNRQMLQKEEITGMDVDAPLGVFSYCIDAQKEGDTKWLSQNSIISQAGVMIEGGISVAPPGTKLELGTEVHATAHGNSASEGFWLPMYFTNWIGKSLAIPDKDAEEIHQTKAGSITPAQSRYTNPAYYKSLPRNPPYTDAEIAALIEAYKKSNTLHTIPKKTFHPYVQNPEHTLSLEYGNTYNFRIRLMDLTGGSPTADDSPLHGAARPVENWHFKRHTSAASVQIKNVEAIFNAATNAPASGKDTSILENLFTAGKSSLTIARPLLAYPAVVFTGKYKNPDAVSRLKAILTNLPSGRKEAVIGLPDPDVSSFKVLVEIKSLEMDNALSATGKEPFVKLYEKAFSFSANYEEAFELNISYENYDQLPFDNSFADTGSSNELRLPANRHLRLSFFSLIAKADNVYADESIATGKPVILSSYKLSSEGSTLLSPVEEGIKALYLQPENDGHKKAAVGPGNIGPVYIYPEKQVVKSTTPEEMERIADAINVSAHNLTLEGKKGERVQFGCTRQMRHSLAPDSSSVTFSSLNEIFNHWILAVNYTLQRDWSWDALQTMSFVVYRKVRTETGAFGPEKQVGSIDVKNTANINSLLNPERDYTNLIFLDTLDPKEYTNPFPSELFVQYRIVPQLKAGAVVPDITPATIHLPVTIIPAQVPKLISAGIALSPYQSDEKYTQTVTRQKFLWLEMEEPVQDPNDSYFVRVLASSPDPMLCRIDNALLFNVPVEPELNINPEKIRMLMPGMDNDYAGVGAMQEMIPEDAPSPRFYMVPLPNGLHAESDELFGFFTYEIRVGHKKELWSTAQGRYGRPLKVNGVQHPAPALFANAFRRKYKGSANLPVNEIAVSAPFANAVFNGRNVASTPPQTHLWAFLYAQIKQADGKAYRNILLGSKVMKYLPSKYRREEGNRLGVCAFNQLEISRWLRDIGLPVSSRLSILCAELFPLSNRWNVADEVKKPQQPVPGAGYIDLLANTKQFAPQYFLFTKAAEETESALAKSLETAVAAAVSNEPANPLIEGLGRFRIYRTSALVPVDNICCDDC